MTVRARRQGSQEVMPQNGMLERMIRATEENAKNGAALVEILRDVKSEVKAMNEAQNRLVEVARRTEERIEQSDATASRGRDDAVEQVKEHITAEIKSNTPPVLIGWIIAGASTVAAGALTAIAVLSRGGHG